MKQSESIFLIFIIAALLTCALLFIPSLPWRISFISGGFVLFSGLAISSIYKLKQKHFNKTTSQGFAEEICIKAETVLLQLKKSMKQMPWTAARQSGEELITILQDMIIQVRENNTQASRLSSLLINIIQPLSESYVIISNLSSKNHPNFQVILSDFEEQLPNAMKLCREAQISLSDKDLMDLKINLHLLKNQVQEKSIQD